MESTLDTTGVPVHRAVQKPVVAWMPAVKSSLEEMFAELSHTDIDIERLHCHELALEEHNFVVLFERLCAVFETFANDEMRVTVCNILMRLVDLQLRYADLIRWSLMWQRVAALVSDKRSSVSVQYNLLSVVKSLCQRLLPDIALALSADSLIRNLLQNNAVQHHQILEACAEIKTIVVIHIPAVQISQYKQDFALLWQTLRRHPDARTRMVAYILLYQLTQSTHHQPGVHLYSQLVAGFLDSSDQIRRLCIHLAVYFARIYADYPVAPFVVPPAMNTSFNTTASHSGRGIQPLKHTVVDDRTRLADDAFAKTCDLVNDVEPAVRLDAITALSLMSEAVSEHFIMQTLEKKLMSNMRSKASAHDRQKDLFDSGDWGSGRKWTSDAPRGDIVAGHLTLLPMRACGAFIHALEDELKIVRSAAVDSIVLIARFCGPFAVKSVDFVIDMFNDEIELVRQKAIQALSLLFRFVNTTDSDAGTQTNYKKLFNSRLRLRPDQLEIVLAVLQESSRDIRTALLHTVPRLAYTNSECLIMMLNAFLQNLQRNPADFDAVCESLKVAGTRQHEFVIELFDRLMQIHPYLDTSEPNIDDHNYVATVVLVTNACALQPNHLVHRFPKFFAKHYSYMSYRYPDWVPQIDYFSKLLHSRTRQSSHEAVNDLSRLADDSTVKREVAAVSDAATAMNKRIKLEAENGSALPVPTTSTNTLDDSVAILVHFQQAVARLAERLNGNTFASDNISSQQQLYKQIACLTNDCTHVMSVGAPETTGVASFVHLLSHCIHEFFKLHSPAVSSRTNLSNTVRKVYVESAELMTVFTGLSLQEKYWLHENHFLMIFFAVTRCGYRSGKTSGENVNGPAAVTVSVKRENVDVDFKEAVHITTTNINNIDPSSPASVGNLDWRSTSVAKLPLLCAALLKLTSFVQANRKSDFLKLSQLGLEFDRHSPAELTAMPCAEFIRNIVGKCSNRNPQIFCPTAGLDIARKTALLTVEQSSAVPTLRTGGGAAVSSRSSALTSLASPSSSRGQVHEFAENLAMHLDVAVELRGFNSNDISESADPVTSGLCVVVDYPDGKRDITFLNTVDIIDTDAVLHGRSNDKTQVLHANDLTQRLFAYSQKEDEQKSRKNGQVESKSSDTINDVAVLEKAAVINLRRRIYLWHESWSNAVHVTLYVAISSDFADIASDNWDAANKNENIDGLLNAAENNNSVMLRKPLLMPISSKESLLIRPRKS